jgi:hypothetical protein
LKSEDIKPLYMRSLQHKSLTKDLLPFVQNLSQDTMQMTISLLYTKLEKISSPITNKLLNEVISTDKNIKSTSLIPPMLKMRLMAWNLIQISK